MKLHEYALKGDCAGVQRELAKGVQVDARDEHDYTPLAYAISSPNADEQILRTLVNAGADVNAAVDGSRKFPIGLAASSGNLRNIQLLLDTGANIKAASPKGYTVLINAMYSLHDSELLLPVLELLVKNGAEIEGETDYGESPLSVASYQGRFDAVKYLLDAGANPSPLKWTEIMKSVAIGSCEEVNELLGDPNILTGRDSFHRTPWLLATIIGDIDKAILLHSAGAVLDERGRSGETALMYCATKDNAQMLKWLVDTGADINAVDESGNTALMLAAQSGATTCVRLLLEASANVNQVNEYDENAMSMASNTEVVRILAGAGEDIGDINTEMKRTLTGLCGGQHLDVTRSQFLSGKHPRFGRSNPEVMNVPFWREMVKAGISAYQARAQFGDTETRDKPVWCFARIGTSFTELPDGRFVQIGGEHEAFYDPDFCIYNDVIVHLGPGDFQIMGYPHDVFPPTDFHSATCVAESIYVIGGLRYQGSRTFGSTPIYRLNCRTWRIDAVESFGDNPGWIYKHRTRLLDSDVLAISGGKVCKEIAGREQHIENTDHFCLNLSTMIWSRR